jgi:RNA polymerase sigma-70 factor (ECF subfamily)
MDSLEADVKSRLAEQRGDAAASAIIRALGPEILRFLLATARDEADANDAFAAWAERVWKHLPGFRWDCALRSWAYVVARTAFLDQVRREGRRERREAPMESVVEVAAEVRTATLSLYRAENVDAISRLRQSLSEDDRLLLVLRLDRDLAWNEIAEVFLRDDQEAAPEAAALGREAARLRKRFQLVKERLYELAAAEGLVRSR